MTLGVSEPSAPVLVINATDDQLRIMRMMAAGVAKKEIRETASRFGVGEDFLTEAFKDKNTAAWKEALTWLRLEASQVNTKGSLSTVDGCINELQGMLKKAQENDCHKEQLEIILTAATIHLRKGAQRTNHSAPKVDFDVSDGQSQLKADAIMKTLDTPLVPGFDPIGSGELEPIDDRFATAIEGDGAGFTDDAVPIATEDEQ